MGAGEDTWMAVIKRRAWSQGRSPREAAARSILRHAWWFSVSDGVGHMPCSQRPAWPPRAPHHACHGLDAWGHPPTCGAQHEGDGGSLRNHTRAHHLLGQILVTLLESNQTGEKNARGHEAPWRGWGCGRLRTRHPAAGGSMPLAAPEGADLHVPALEPSHTSPSRKLTDHDQGVLPLCGPILVLLPTCRRHADKPSQCSPVQQPAGKGGWCAER